VEWVAAVVSTAEADIADRLSNACSEVLHLIFIVRA
jgi:hypothetical protein